MRTRKSEEDTPVEEKAEDRKGSDPETPEHQRSPVTAHLNVEKEDQTDPRREEDQDQDRT